MSSFLLELFSEEIPARMQAFASEELKNRITDVLNKTGIAYDTATSYVTPRRLILSIDGLPETQADFTEERKGPSVNAPEQALNGFLKSTGLSKDELVIQDTPKGRFYFANIVRKGRATADVLKETTQNVMASFPWPKSMRWASHQEHWVRPLQSILCLFDEKIVPVSFAGKTASDKTRGHRFMAPAEISVKNFDDYREKLRKAYVIIDPNERKQIIMDEIRRIADEKGLVLHEDDALLNEVAGLAEYPVALAGRIDDDFMNVPKEVLITSMKTHQKYFSLLTQDGQLAPWFIVVSNIKAPDGGKEIIAGNERVLRARLSDARFFWDEDRKQKLEDKVEKLKTRVFHAKLGTIYDKVDRIRRLLPFILEYIPDANADDADRAALLCKADLSSGMVGEFPELQGVMGRYYALNDGENDAVASAIAEHYAPQGPNDKCPTSPVSVALALADKIDTLIGFWLIDLKPTGSKDPFALRRAALGLIRLLLENKIRMPLLTVFQKARTVYGDSIQNAVRQAITEMEKKNVKGSQPVILTNWSVLQTEYLLSFVTDRLKVYLKESGIRHDYITAVYNLAKTHDLLRLDLIRMLARVQALQTFLASEDGLNLLTAYKRAANIVRKEEDKDNVSYQDTPEKARFVQTEEGALFDTLDKVVLNSSKKIADDDFEGAMEVLATLRRPVDAFFDNVTVNCDDVKRRANRLRLLSAIVSAMGGVADFSVIEG